MVLSGRVDCWECSPSARPCFSSHRTSQPFRADRQCAKRQRHTSARAESETPGGDKSRRRLPFERKREQKEDAARKALEGMFKGKKDVLASFDTGGGGGTPRGPQRKGTGGGGDGQSGGWRPPNWRQLLAAGGGKLSRGSRSVLALLGFVALALALPLIPATLGFTVRLFKIVLGLDGRARSARSPQSTADFRHLATHGGTLGASEASVIAKYGSDDVSAAQEHTPIEGSSSEGDEESPSSQSPKVRVV